MKYCSHCGDEAGDNTFCPSCGKEISRENKRKKNEKCKQNKITNVLCTTYSIGYNSRRSYEYALYASDK